MSSERFCILQLIGDRQSAMLWAVQFHDYRMQNCYLCNTCISWKSELMFCSAISKIVIWFVFYCGPNNSFCWSFNTYLHNKLTDCITGSWSCTEEICVLYNLWIWSTLNSNVISISYASYFRPIGYAFVEHVMNWLKHDTRAG